MLKCNGCKILKPEGDFYKKYGKPNLNKCKECIKLYHNIPEIKKRIKENYLKHREISVAKNLLRAARKRSIKQGIDFTITVDDIVVPDVCPVFGIKLKPSDIYSTDESPSLDRFNPEKGYIPGNVFVISNKANRMKSNASAEDVKLLHEWMLKINQRFQH